MRTMIYICVGLTSACASVYAPCEVRLQATDNPASPFRAREICAKEGYEGTLERTKCRSATRLDKDSLPKECR